MWLKDESTLRNRMKEFPKFDTQGFRDCQVFTDAGLKDKTENVRECLLWDRS